MMIRVVSSSEFRRALKRLRKNPAIKARIDRVIHQLTIDPHHPSLRTHRLGGEMSGVWACSAAYDLRILFRFVRDSETNEQYILLVDVGSHDQVY